MPKFFIYVALTTEDETPQNLAQEIRSFLEHGTDVEVLSIIVLDEKRNDLHVFEKGKKT